MATRQDLLTVELPSAAPSRSGERSLFSPTIDFLCLGGGSLIVLALVALFVSNDFSPQLALIGMMVAHVVNHPHFAHSYQIFYKDFGAKLAGRGYSRGLQRRYIAAGIVVPILLAGFFAATVLGGDARTLGIAGNVMTFFVGWHYVKQGYGMLMLDAALKKRFFGNREKTLFLVNAYVTWLSFWLTINAFIAEQKMWGLEYYTIPTPMVLVYLSLGTAGITTLLTLYVFVRKLVASRDGLAWNGAVAYLTSVYAWLFLVFTPLLVFVIPAFHSLQYLTVVWRYRWNLDSAAPDATTKPSASALGRALPSARYLRFAGFIGLGLILGYAAFWGIPKFLDAVVPYDQSVFGPTLFLFVFWIFINVHHYFLDNVMWRRGNPDTKRYLFG